MIQISPETLPVTIPEALPKTNQTTENAQLAENKIILGGIRNEEKNVGSSISRNNGYVSWNKPLLG